MELPEAIDHLTRADARLGRLIRAVGPMTLRPQRRVPPYESLAKAIVHQQLNGRAARTIWGRLRDRLPTKGRFDPREVAVAGDTSLRAVGLSRAKLAALRDLTAHVLDGRLPSARRIARMPDEEIVDALTGIRGIGRWTVEMMLIFKLGRPDVLPATDYGIRQGFALTYRRKELPAVREVLEHGERWRPHRSTASWYLWRATDLAAGRWPPAS